MESKAFVGMIMFALLFLLLHSHNILLSAATLPLPVSSNDNHREILEYGEIQDYDSPGANRRHDPPTPTPTPESSMKKHDEDGKKLKLIEVEVDPSTAYDYAQPGPNPHNGRHSSRITQARPNAKH